VSLEQSKQNHIISLTQLCVLRRTFGFNSPSSC